MNVTIHCCFCSKKTEHEIELPTGWAHRYDGIDDEQNGFCPEHSAIAEFAYSQCPGCVGGWGDCGLWRAFAFSGRRALTPDDFTIIERGRCPRRVNGTLVVDPAGINDLDLSTVAKTESGVALALAIRDYWATYPE